MGIITKLIKYIDEKTVVEYTEPVDTLTKYGMFKFKTYKYKKQNYLVILSQNFFDVKTPIFYIHSNEHECNSIDEFCGCNYPIGIALKMIHKDGGLILYSNSDDKGIDVLLSEINVRKLQLQNEVLRGRNFKPAILGYKAEYLTIDFILKELKLSNIQLVSDNPNIIFIVERLGIEIIKQAYTISFDYGR